jgi:hypothetical protein
MHQEVAPQSSLSRPTFTDYAGNSRCHQGRHEVVMNVDHLPGDLTVPSFGPRMVCTKCGMVGDEPNWRERGT